MHNKNRLPSSIKKFEMNQKIKLIRVLIFILLCIPIALISFVQIKQRFFETNLKQRDIHEMYLYIEAKKKMPDKYENLWEKIRPTSIAFERISLDIENRIEKKSRYFDKGYTEGLIAELEDNILREPRLSLYLLSYFSTKGKKPIKQAMAMIAIREMYPKKYCLYSSNHLINSQNSMLSELSKSIIKNEYTPSSIKEKFTPKYFRSLMKENEIQSNDKDNAS